MKIIKIDHIGIAVKNESKLEEFFKLSGLGEMEEEIVERENLKVKFVKIGDVDIELLFPLNENASVAKFIDKKGQGIHHIAYEVEDIEKLTEAYKNKGFRLINEKPVEGAHNTKVVFLHPTSLDGVLTELVEKKKS